MRFIQIHPSDNVAVALENLKAGENAGVILREDIGRGHKFALRPIRNGEDIVKYGMPIGTAKADIAAGEKVHTHNIRTRLDGVLNYEYHPDLSHAPHNGHEDFFMGYRRFDGRVGIRNNIWIIPTVGCVNTLAENLAKAANEKLPAGAVERVIALPHPYGCSQLGTDHALTRRILADFVRHPNAGGVLVAGLGCENNTIAEFKKEVGAHDEKRVRFMIAQEEEDEFETGMRMLEELIENAKNDQRVKVPVSELVVGLKCGGSDGLSGITANALVGRFSDRLTASGGTSILSEVPEMFGAETLLMNRCITPEVFEKCVKMINDFKNYFTRYGQTIYENPSPGNKEGGISTLEDKSLGCTQKGGAGTVVDVLDMGETVKVKGLNLLNGPGNDMVATTLLSAAGAHIVLFTTGRGTPFGGVVPTLKIASNTALAEKKPHWIDFNAGQLVESEKTPAAVDEDFYRLVLDTASGRPAKNEEHSYEEIAIFKDGVTL